MIKLVIKPKRKKVKVPDDPYCKVCGGCGFIGCCGIRDFIEKHVRGKTNCPNEAIFLDEIIETIEATDYFKINHPGKAKGKRQPAAI